jgi:hypothetical protein
MEEYKDKFGNPLSVYPLNVEKDTLMACFSVFLYGSETLRVKLRYKLLAHFRKCFESSKPYIHNCIRSFVSHLHSKNPAIPKSAEAYFMESEAKFRAAGEQFIILNQESFISDKYTFAYIVSELFKVHVHFLDETVISCHMFDDSCYTIHILGNFQLLTHVEKIQRVHFKPSNGLEYQKSNIVTSKIELRISKDGKCPIIGKFVPPHIVGYKVHKLYSEDFDPNSVHVVTFKEPILKEGETLYIYENYNCISSISYNARVNSYFYIQEKLLQCVVAKNQDDADKAVRYETL